jgi:hypothetical protein
MRRRLFIVCAVIGALLLCSSALAAVPTTGPAQAQPSEEHASGIVIAVARGSFAIESGGGRMSVVNALTNAANLVTEGDFPYVYGGGHAQAGIASIGIKGPGYNGRRIGLDCSGAVAAVLAGAGIWQPTSGVPNDAGIIAQLRSEHLIARGAGHGASEVTLYDDPGVHIFMNIDGHFFGTSDGGGGGNPAGGAGWLDDGAADATSHIYKRYHLLLGVIRRQTTFERILTFQTVGHSTVTHGLELGSDVHVGYTQAPDGRMTAEDVS